jgi:hypothetical protein
MPRRLDCFPHWPHPTSLAPHPSVSGVGRMQEVWRDGP